MIVGGFVPVGFAEEAESSLELSGQDVYLGHVGDSIDVSSLGLDLDSMLTTSEVGLPQLRAPPLTIPGREGLIASQTLDDSAVQDLLVGIKEKFDAEASTLTDLPMPSALGFSIPHPEAVLASPSTALAPQFPSLVAVRPLNAPVAETTPAEDLLGSCAARTVGLAGTAGDDVIVGTSGNDVIAGGPGLDVIYGMGGSDVICAGSGDDIVFGGDGSDIVFSGSGDDQVYGDGLVAVESAPAASVVPEPTVFTTGTFGGAADTLDGGPGCDYLVGELWATDFAAGPSPALVLNGAADTFTDPDFADAYGELQAGNVSNGFQFNGAADVFNVVDVCGLGWWGESATASAAASATFRGGADRFNVAGSHGAFAIGESFDARSGLSIAAAGGTLTAVGAGDTFTVLRSQAVEALVGELFVFDSDGIHVMTGAVDTFSVGDLIRLGSDTALGDSVYAREIYGELFGSGTPGNQTLTGASDMITIGNVGLGAISEGDIGVQTILGELVLADEGSFVASSAYAGSFVRATLGNDNIRIGAVGTDAMASTILAAALVGDGISVTHGGVVIVVGGADTTNVGDVGRNARASAIAAGVMTDIFQVANALTSSLTNGATTISVGTVAEEAVAGTAMVVLLLGEVAATTNVQGTELIRGGTHTIGVRDVARDAVLGTTVILGLLGTLMATTTTAPTSEAGPVRAVTHLSTGGTINLGAVCTGCTSLAGIVVTLVLGGVYLNPAATNYVLTTTGKTINIGDVGASARAGLILVGGLDGGCLAAGLCSGIESAGFSANNAAITLGNGVFNVGTIGDGAEAGLIGFALVVGQSVIGEATGTLSVIAGGDRIETRDVGRDARSDVVLAAYIIGDLIMTSSLGPSQIRAGGDNIKTNSIAMGAGAIGASGAGIDQLILGELVAVASEAGLLLQGGNNVVQRGPMCGFSDLACAVVLSVGSLLVGTAAGEVRAALGTNRVEYGDVGAFSSGSIVAALGIVGGLLQAASNLNAAATGAAQSVKIGDIGKHAGPTAAILATVFIGEAIVVVTSVATAASASAPPGSAVAGPVTMTIGNVGAGAAAGQILVTQIVGRLQAVQAEGPARSIGATSRIGIGTIGDDATSSIAAAAVIVGDLTVVSGVGSVFNVPSGDTIDIGNVGRAARGGLVAVLLVVGTLDTLTVSDPVVITVSSPSTITSMPPMDSIGIGTVAETAQGVSVLAGLVIGDAYAVTAPEAVSPTVSVSAGASRITQRDIMRGATGAVGLVEAYVGDVLSVTVTGGTTTAVGGGDDITLGGIGEFAQVKTGPLLVGDQIGIWGDDVIVDGASNAVLVGGGDRLAAGNVGTGANAGSIVFRSFKGDSLEVSNANVASLRGGADTMRLGDLSRGARAGYTGAGGTQGEVLQASSVATSTALLGGKDGITFGSMAENAILEVLNSGNIGGEYVEATNAGSVVFLGSDDMIQVGNAATGAQATGNAFFGNAYGEYVLLAGSSGTLTGGPDNIRLGNAFTEFNGLGDASMGSVSGDRFFTESATGLVTVNGGADTLGVGDVLQGGKLAGSLTVSNLFGDYVHAETGAGNLVLNGGNDGILLGKVAPGAALWGTFVTSVQGEHLHVLDGQDPGFNRVLRGGDDRIMIGDVSSAARIVGVTQVTDVSGDTLLVDDVHGGAMVVGGRDTLGIGSVGVGASAYAVVFDVFGDEVSATAGGASLLRGNLDAITIGAISGAVIVAPVDAETGVFGDLLTGGPGDDILMAGDDTITVGKALVGEYMGDEMVGQAGNDTMVGGNNTITTGDTSFGVHQVGTHVLGGADQDVIIRLWTNRLTSGAGSDLLDGGDYEDVESMPVGVALGSDRLSAGAGDDLLECGEGAGETGDGGAGFDTHLGGCETLAGFP